MSNGNLGLYQHRYFINCPASLTALTYKTGKTARTVSGSPADTGPPSLVPIPPGQLPPRRKKAHVAFLLSSRADTAGLKLLVLLHVYCYTIKMLCHCVLLLSICSSICTVWQLELFGILRDVQCASYVHKLSWWLPG